MKELQRRDQHTLSTLSRKVLRVLPLAIINWDFWILEIKAILAPRWCLWFGDNEVTKILQLTRCWRRWPEAEERVNFLIIGSTKGVKIGSLFGGRCGISESVPLRNYKKVFLDRNGKLVSRSYFILHIIYFCWLQSGCRRIKSVVDNKNIKIGTYPCKDLIQ